MVDQHNYYCLSRPVYVFLAFFGIVNLFLSVFLGNYAEADEYNPSTSLLIINILNASVGVYEILNLKKRA